MITPGRDERTLYRLRRLCLSFPETSETASWGHPNFRAGGRMFAVFERVKGRPSIGFRVDAGTARRLLAREGFFVTPYGRGLWVSLWVDRRIDWRLVAALLESSYRRVAPKRLIAALDGRRARSPRPAEAPDRGGRGLRTRRTSGDGEQGPGRRPGRG